MSGFTVWMVVSSGFKDSVFFLFLRYIKTILTIEKYFLQENHYQELGLNIQVQMKELWQIQKSSHSFYRLYQMLKDEKRQYIKLHHFHQLHPLYHHYHHRYRHHHSRPMPLIFMALHAMDQLIKIYMHWSKKLLDHQVISDLIC